jgi:delta14-sterol reductase
MKPQCYFVVSLCLLVAVYEYQRMNPLEDPKELTWQLVFSNVLLTLERTVPTTASLGILCAYFSVIYLLTFIAPGYSFQGPPIRDGRVLTYPINGLSVLVGTLGVYFTLGKLGVMSWSIAYDHYAGLLVWCNIIAASLSLYLFLRGRIKGLASGKGVWEDFVMGQELVPNFLGLTFNFFWLRPSMMLWLFLNLSFLAKHYEVTGTISHAMVLYQCFTNWYIVDYFIFEEYVTSTWDMIAEK